MHRTVILAAVLVAGLALAASRAGEPKERKGPLAELPSEPGEHIGKIEALGEGQWLNLGAPKPDPEWGIARGRAYTYRMAFAPDLRGAFLYGEGAHGTFRQDGYVQDGLWLYDLNAHAWICCYPGTNAANAGLKLNADGWWEDKDGQLVPVTVMHGWDQIAYDPERKLFAAGKKGSYYSKPKIKGLDYGGKDPKKTSDAGLWFWDTRTGLWHPHQDKGPRVNFGDNLVYLPGMKKLWYWNGREQVHLYDYEKESWGALKPAGPRPPFSMEAVSVYDPKRDRVYVGGGGKCESTESLWVYDVKENTWTNAKAANSRYKSWPGNGSATANFDTVSDRLVMFHFGDRTVNVYDPEQNSWSSQPLDEKVDTGVRGRLRWNAFYDPESNAHYFHAAGDSKTDGVIWAYRYKKADVPGEQTPDSR